jgi:hypothetical protein
MRLVKTVYIKPYLLKPNIIETVELQAKEKYLGSCTSEHGYITHISNIVILDTCLEYSLSDVSVKVSLSVNTAKPYVGERCSCTITSQIPQGTMLIKNLKDNEDVVTSFKLFVPIAYANNELGLSILDSVVGSDVNVEILAVKYDKQQFTCIAKYI